MSNKNTTKEMEPFKIPEFINTKKNNIRPFIEKDLEFIKVGEKNINKKDWKILKELNDLIGLILSKQDEPIDSTIKYTIINNNSYTKTEKIKGTIRINK